VESVQYLCAALLGVQSGAFRASEVLEGDLALFPGVRKYGVGWRFSHGLLEFHGAGIDQSHHDGMIKEKISLGRINEKLGQSQPIVQECTNHDSRKGDHLIQPRAGIKCED
jgi:hypothetical protein